MFALQDALAQPLGGNISAEQRRELEKRADAMRAAAARLQRVSGERQLQMCCALHYPIAAVAWAASLQACMHAVQLANRMCI